MTDIQATDIFKLLLIEIPFSATILELFDLPSQIQGFSIYHVQ